MKCLVLKSKFFSVLLLVLAMSTQMAAQEFIVKSFQTMEKDLIARTKERLDLNGTPCAVVRVAVPESESFVFEGNIIGEPVYSKGEALVYMTARSRNITIKSGEYGSMVFEFPERLQKQVAYRLELQLRYKGEYKKRTLVLPMYSYGQGNVHTGGIMLGIVRKTGGYIKAKWNFGEFDVADYRYECDANGKLDNGQNAWYTNYYPDESGTYILRYAITAGVLQRIALPLYLYAGAGYGVKDVCWELESADREKYGNYVRNKDDSAKGVEVETGIIFRFAGFALSAGVQTCAFKHWEVSAGFGLMF